MSPIPSPLPGYIHWPLAARSTRKHLLECTRLPSQKLRWRLGLCSASPPLEWSPAKLPGSRTGCWAAGGPRLAETPDGTCSEPSYAPRQREPAEQKPDHEGDASPARPHPHSHPLHGAHRTHPKTPNGTGLSHAREIATEVAKERAARGEKTSLEDDSKKVLGQTRTLHSQSIPNR